MAGLNIHTRVPATPQCYAYITPGVPEHKGWTKIGFTERDVDTRIWEQTHTAGLKYECKWAKKATYISKPYGTFTDRDFHAYLKKLGIEREAGTEWFKIEPDEAERHFKDFIDNHGVLAGNDRDATIPYRLRQEQEEAVNKALIYFKNHENSEFLWNCKPRFGKTLAAYGLCRRMGAVNVLIVTNRPAIADSWYQDYETFFGPQSGYLFVSHVDSIKDRKYVLSREEYQEEVHRRKGDMQGCLEFVSLQDLKGSLYFGGQYEKLAELSKEKKGIVWDLMIVDEAHEGVDTYKTDTAFNHIRRKYTLHLSGTPFKALANEKFPEEAIYNWTYVEEQEKKQGWDDSNELENPYRNLPALSLFTYQMSDVIRNKVKKGIELADQEVEEYAFDLNEFFRTDEEGRFIHDKEVDCFLDALTQQEKFPFSTPALREELKHTFWLLNRVASARELARKLKLHPIFKDYEVVLAAGDGRVDDDDENEKSLDKVRRAIRENDKTITLSVGQLTTGVTIPEWTAVLMLSSLSSPSLYMQAAFRAQNPCLFQEAGDKTYRKKNAYVFDFDPARSLTIFDRFANDLIPEEAGEKDDLGRRKRKVKELLNYFPVYGEDEGGKMVQLDEEAVLTIPRHIHAMEVVDRGFMSNFLFANISNIFGAPREIIDLINNMQPVKMPKKASAVQLDSHTADSLNLNEEGEVAIPEERVIGLAHGLFGERIYRDIGEELTQTADSLARDHAKEPNPEGEDLRTLREKFSKPVSDRLMETARQQYGDDLKKSTRHQLERKIQESTDRIVDRAYGDYRIRDQQLKREGEEKIREAQEAGDLMPRISQLDEEYHKRRLAGYEEMVKLIRQNLRSEEVVEKAAETIVETVETEKRQAEKDTIEGSVRDHLRGFSRTIPAFLMAYGDENTTLANFDSLVPADVFLEVTMNPQTGRGVSLEQFRMLRDGGDYYLKDEEGREIRDDDHKKYFRGHLFDEPVFNEAVAEFMKRRRALANYFDEEEKGDIFDYIPAQRTNQIFTPKSVVKDMIDRLEKENPGCFDDPEATFADLYMKSGMYITEIVSRLYRSRRMKALFPDKKERLNHIFSQQVYGCAPTEIIYRICLRYILGFSEEIPIERHNIRLLDTLPYAKDGTLEEELKKVFH